MAIANELERDEYALYETRVLYKDTELKKIFHIHANSYIHREVYYFKLINVLIMRLFFEATLHSYLWKIVILSNNIN